MLIAGFDIGGTKCAALIARAENGIEFLCRSEIPTSGGWKQILSALARETESMLQQLPSESRILEAVGISCGGPLDTGRGLVLSPPNLPGWDEVPVCDFFSGRFGVPAFLMNDADACAVAEWTFGAGAGCRHMIFLTFGTGLGAGLILNGMLYTGACGCAGEVGHLRLCSEGPVGYGKRGSFEGFCSGGGIAQQAQNYLREIFQSGVPPALCSSPSALPAITAKDIVLAADAGDPDALAILSQTGRRFGQGLAVLVDLLNPEVIAAGGVFMRGYRHIVPAMQQALAEEALPSAVASCRILPSALGERIGDYGCIAAALYGQKHRG